MKKDIKDINKKKVTNKKQEATPMNKVSKITLIVCGIILLILLLCVLLGELFPSFATFFWYYIRNPYIGFFFKLFEFNPKIGTKFPLVLLVIYFLLFFIQLVLEKNKQVTKKFKTKYVNLIAAIEYIIIMFMFIPLILDLSSHNHYKLNEEYFNENINTEYTKEDIIALATYYKNNTMNLADDFERENGEIIFERDLTEVAVEDLLNVSNKFKFLKGLYPDKVADFSKEERENNLDGTLGYTQSFGIVADKNENNIALLNTITHELCHTKGIVRESETEFCAYIANVNSNEKFSNYSAYYNAFYRLSTAVSLIDQNLGYELEDDFVTLCLTDNYKEACNFYHKQLNEFIDGTDYLQIGTYRLENYPEYKSILIELLNTLITNYNAELFINDEKIDIETVKQRIDEGSTDIVNIDIKIQEKEFEKLASYLNVNQRYFLYIYQTDEDYEYDEFLTGEEALNYYLKPFDRNDFSLLLSGEYTDEYYYERVTRLLLEYNHEIFR